MGADRGALPGSPRGRGAALAASLAAALVLVTGCSGGAAMPGEQGPTATDLPATSAPGRTTMTDTASGEYPGLSPACGAVLGAQVTISSLLAEPVDGHKITVEEVTTAFGSLSPELPADLDGSIAVLRDAADRAVTKSAVAVAKILAEKEVTDASDALSAAVSACQPVTSAGD